MMKLTDYIDVYCCLVIMQFTEKFNSSILRQQLTELEETKLKLMLNIRGRQFIQCCTMSYLNTLWSSMMTMMNMMTINATSSSLSSSSDADNIIELKDKLSLQKDDQADIYYYLNKKCKQLSSTYITFSCCRHSRAVALTLRLLMFYRRRSLRSDCLAGRADPQRAIRCASHAWMDGQMDGQMYVWMDRFLLMYRRQ